MITKASRRKDGVVVGIYSTFDEARKDVENKVEKGYIWDVKRVGEEYHLYKAPKR